MAITVGVALNMIPANMTEDQLVEAWTALMPIDSTDSRFARAAEQIEDIVFELNHRGVAAQIID